MGYKGILYGAVPEEESETYGNCITSPHGHSDLFDTTFGLISADYLHYPRGRIVYDMKRGLHIIYIDKCILDTVPEVKKLFNLNKYEVDYDEHYVCPGCREELEF